MVPPKLICHPQCAYGVVYGLLNVILAFCDDYMTEKLFRPLNVGSVPVYRGSRLAREFMPDDHSIIMTEDFDSPESLARFLHKLNENDEEYDVSTQY